MQKIWFSIKKKYGGRIFFRKWQNPKSEKKSVIFLLLVIFCSSEEPPAIIALVQFRVITSFKLLNKKGFYSVNVPEVMQKLAHVEILLNPETHAWWPKGCGFKKEPNKPVVTRWTGDWGCLCKIRKESGGNSCASKENWNSCVLNVEYFKNSAEFNFCNRFSTKFLKFSAKFGSLNV